MNDEPNTKRQPDIAQADLDAVTNANGIDHEKVLKTSVDPTTGARLVDASGWPAGLCNPAMG